VEVMDRFLRNFVTGNATNGSHVNQVSKITTLVRRHFTKSINCTTDPFLEKKRSDQGRTGWTINYNPVIYNLQLYTIED